MIEYAWERHWSLSPETWFLINHGRHRYVGTITSRASGEWVVNKRDDINFGVVLPAGLSLDEAQGAAKLMILAGAQQ